MSTKTACLDPAGPAPAAAAAGPAPEVPLAEPTPEQVLAEVLAEREDYIDALRRLQAEFDNYRTRARRERAAEAERALVRAVRHLLPAFDALDAAHTGHPQIIDPLLQVLDAALSDLDVHRLEPVGEEFDPRLHDAVEMTDDIAEGTAAGTGHGPPVVAEVLRPGYRCRTHLVRPAAVRVAAAANNAAGQR